LLAKHIVRICAQYHAAKLAKKDALQDDDRVVIQIDWSENYRMEQAQEEKDVISPACFSFQS
ncbi:unnamed protein product, partial [Didymodactylos carnosus]